MATFEQNIRKIRGEAIYGTDVRSAIAEAIQQTMNLDIEGSTGTVYFSVTPIQNSVDDYLLTVSNGGQ